LSSIGDVAIITRIFYLVVIGCASWLAQSLERTDHVLAFNFTSVPTCEAPKVLFLPHTFSLFSRSSPPSRPPVLQPCYSSNRTTATGVKIHYDVPHAIRAPSLSLKAAFSGWQKADVVITPDKSTFNDSIFSYAFLESRLRPYCIVRPQGSDDVATAVRILGQDDSVKFAIRSGGHSINKGLSSFSCTKAQS
jgi:hypothetical protein